MGLRVINRLFLFNSASSHIICTFLSFILASSAVKMAEYDLDFGKKNDYVPAKSGDGGQGEFGAVSPNDWRVPGTSPVGQSSYKGAADGGDEPWFSEAVSTVFLDLKKADDTLKAFTKEAADFKIAAFAEENGVEKSKAYDSLVGAMGYDKFLEASAGQLKKEWEKMNPPKVDPAAEAKAAEAKAAAPKKEKAAPKKAE
jgi:hypothetical protein